MEEGLVSLKYQKARVYVVDDEEDVLSLVDSVLGKSFEVTTFTAPEALLKRSETDVPDLYILDYILPSINGLALLKELRYRGVTKPALVLSGATHYREAIEAIQVGVMDLIEKPFSNERLLFSVSRAVATGMIMEARDNLIVAFSELTEAQAGLNSHYEFLLDANPERESALSTKAQERVAHARKQVDFIRQKQDMLDVMVGHYTEE